MIENLQLKTDIEELIDIANREIFYDGMDSFFSRQLDSLFIKYDNIILIEVISEFIAKKLCEDSVVSEFLTQITNHSNNNTIDKILCLLVINLKSKSVEIRDSATNAFDALGDVRAIVFLEEAIEQEQNTELRQDMENVLSELISQQQNLLILRYFQFCIIIVL